MSTKQIRTRLDAVLEELVTARVIEETRYVHGKLAEMRRERDSIRAEIESIRPKIATPIEVEGFRVGDLVALNPNGAGAWGRVAGFEGPLTLVDYPDHTQPYRHEVEKLHRKPVKLGDKVRHRTNPLEGEIVGISPDNVCTIRFSDPSIVTWWILESCIPIAPLQTP